MFYFPTIWRYFHPLYQNEYFRIIIIYSYSFFFNQKRQENAEIALVKTSLYIGLFLIVIQEPASE